MKCVTVHCSFRNGYPAGAQGGTKVVTNRVVLTKEQAEKLLKTKKGLKVKKVK